MGIYVYPKKPMPFNFAKKKKKIILNTSLGEEKDQMQADDHHQGVSTHESHRTRGCKPPRGLVLPAQGLPLHLCLCSPLSSTGHGDHSISDIFTILFQKYLSFSI